VGGDYLRREVSGSVPILPLLPLLLTRDDKPWKNSTCFADLIGVPEGLREEIPKHIPDFECQPLELCWMPFDKIPGTPRGILALRALKAKKLLTLLDDPVRDGASLLQLPTASFEQ
jgi:hypothetical protein